MRTVILWLFALFVVTNFIQQNVLIATRMDSDSMAPALRERDAAYSSTLIYGSARGVQSIFSWGGAPSYGDIVHIRPPYATERPWGTRFLDALVRFLTLQRATVFSEPRLARRIVGLPGDVVRMRDFQFFVAPHAAAQFQSEFTRSPYRYDITHESLPSRWKEYYPLSSYFPEYIVPPMHYFVAADKRIGALDSRAWGGVHRDAIVAPVFLAYHFPFTVRSVRRTPLR